MSHDPDKYNDIIDMKYPFELSHKRMSEYDRAAQFASFKALSGFEEEIDEVSRLTDSQIALDESSAAEIDMKLQIIKEKLDESEQPLIQIVYFEPDIKKDGGKYVSLSARIKRIDEIYKTIQTAADVTISIRDIIELNGEIFEQGFK